MSGDGAVVVVAEAESSLGAGRLLLGAELLVLMGVHDLRVWFDGLDRTPGDPTELVGCIRLRLCHEALLDHTALFPGDPVGQVPVGVEDHPSVLGGDQPLVEGGDGGVMPARPEPAGQADLAGGRGA